MTSTVDQLQPDAGVIEEARRRQRRHRSAASAAVAAGALAAAAAGWLIAGGTGGSHPAAGAGRHSPSAPAASRRGHGGCAPAFGRVLAGRPERSLLSILGVLRRPATQADRLPPGIGVVGDAFAGYVRRTRVIGGRSYFLYPARSGCRPGHEGIMDLAINVDLGHGLKGGTGGGGADAADIEAGRAVSTGPPGSATSATITMVVPDGVASVVLRYPAGRASGYSPRVSPPFTVTTAPVGNEVVVTVPRSAGGGPIWAPKMIWRAADGRVIRVFHSL